MIKLTVLLVLLFWIVTFSATAQWVRENVIPPSRHVNSIVVKGNYLLAGTGTWERSGNVYLSSDYGDSWSPIAFPQIFYTLNINEDFIYAGVNHFYGVYYSTNLGASWSLFNPLYLASQHTRSVISNGANIFVGGTGPGRFSKSTNWGNNWATTTLNREVLSNIIVGSLLIVGTVNQGVFISNDSGLSWQQTSLNNKSVNSLLLHNSKIYAGTQLSGIYTTTNNGVNWVQNSLNSQSVRTLAVSGTKLFAGTERNGIYLTTNEGLDWAQINEGIPLSDTILSMCILNGYVFAGSNDGVWRRPISEFTEIKNISAQIPIKNELSQNYPNPFNPTTNFGFRIADFGLVRLIVFDAIGKEVEILVNQQLQPGTYEVSWDASAYPSGVYYYRLQSGSFAETKKMVLIK